MLGAAELQELADDIRDSKQQQAIISDQHGRIVDGRNRFRACELAGVEPEIEQRVFADDRAVLAFVVSANLRRRHLSESQRADIAGKLANIQHGSNRYAEKVDPQICGSTSPAPISVTEAAEMLNVSPRSVESAKKIHANGIPELQQAVTDGDIKVSRAAQIATLPIEQQPAEVAEAKRTRGKGRSRGRQGSGKARGLKVADSQEIKLIQWGARRKKFTMSEMATATGLSLDSTRRVLRAALAGTGYLVEYLSDSEYRVRKAVHFVTRDQLPGGEANDLLAILRELYDEAVRARKMDQQMGSSVSWSIGDRGRFLDRFISRVSKIIKA
jgi:ParB-like chromosome segregation protein Spo0J